jgi:hypothetical protein
MIKKYWDIIGGILSSVLLAVAVKFELQSILLYNSIIISILVSIGLLRIIKQAVEKGKNRKRKHNIIDDIVDSQKAIKAVSLAEEPTKEGEKLGNLIINFLEVLKTMFNKIKEFFDKYKGYILTVALGALTFIEAHGGFINELAGGVLVIKGVPVIPVATFGLALVVGILSNGFTKEQKEKIKALLAQLKAVKPATNKLVVADIKKIVKEDNLKLKALNKTYSLHKSDLDKLNAERDSKNNTLSAKVELQSLQLATNEDVQFASIRVQEVDNKITEKKQELVAVEEEIAKVKSEISSLKSRL